MRHLVHSTGDFTRLFPTQHFSAPTGLVFAMKSRSSGMPGFSIEKFTVSLSRRRSLREVCAQIHHNYFKSLPLIDGVNPYSYVAQKCGLGSGKRIPGTSIACYVGPTDYESPFIFIEYKGEYELFVLPDWQNYVCRIS